MIVTSINGHVKPEPRREVIAAGPEGAFFCVTLGPREPDGYAAYELLLEPIPTDTILKVYYTADFGRELFRVESAAPEPKQEQKKNWLVKLIIRRRRRS